MKRILITGGAGFVGSALARQFRRADSKAEIIAFDNLRRFGSQRNLIPLQKEGVTFVHGDIRVEEDLRNLEGDFDVFIDAAAEPSVWAGLTSSPDYVLQTNMMGTAHCLKFSKDRVGAFVYLSTSRVYSLAALKNLPLEETSSRFQVTEQGEGFGPNGLRESFSTSTSRSFYGTAKLAGEMLVQEYADACGLKAIINRCGVISGPGQFGKAEQGVFALWVARHLLQKPLTYTGFGGAGKQVRDLLHVDDLFTLIEKQVAGIRDFSGQTFNVGGGSSNSVSLQEYTQVCEEATGVKLEIGSKNETGAFDIPYYVTDNQKVTESFQWKPERNVSTIVGDIARWLREDEQALKELF